MFCSELIICKTVSLTQLFLHYQKQNYFKNIKNKHQFYKFYYFFYNIVLVLPYINIINWCELINYFSNYLPSIYSGLVTMAPHSSTLAWKIPWTEEPGGLQSMGSLRGSTPALRGWAPGKQDTGPLRPNGPPELLDSLFSIPSLLLKGLPH